MTGLYNYAKYNPVNTKHLYKICTTSAQRLRRWSNIVQVLCKCFVFTGKHANIGRGVYRKKIEGESKPQGAPEQAILICSNITPRP